MEELRSTEVLDREILEDARKKAFRILSAADETLASGTKKWGKKKTKAVESIKKTYSDRLAMTEAEILARLPLDKRRLRSEIAEDYLQSAMHKFLLTLSREDLLGVLKTELLERIASISDMEKAELVFSGLSKPEASLVISDVLAALKKNPSHLSSKDQNPDLNPPVFDLHEDKHGHNFPFIVIKAEGIKITSSVETAAGALLKDKRAELASALLGKGILND